MEGLTALAVNWTTEHAMLKRALERVYSGAGCEEADALRDAIHDAGWSLHDLNSCAGAVRPSINPAQSRPVPVVDPAAVPSLASETRRSLPGARQVESASCEVADSLSGEDGHDFVVARTIHGRYFAWCVEAGCDWQSFDGVEQYAYDCGHEHKRSMSSTPEPLASFGAALGSGSGVVQHVGHYVSMTRETADEMQAQRDALSWPVLPKLEDCEDLGGGETRSLRWGDFVGVGFSLSDAYRSLCAAVAASGKEAGF